MNMSAYFWRHTHTHTSLSSSLVTLRRQVFHNDNGEGDAGDEELAIFALLFHGEFFDVALSAGDDIYFCCSPLTHLGMVREALHDDAYLQAPSSPVADWYHPGGAHLRFVLDDHSGSHLCRHWGACLLQRPSAGGGSTSLPPPRGGSTSRSCAG